MYTQLKAKNTELNTSKEEEEKWRIQMDEAKAKEDAKRSDLPALYKERDQVRKLDPATGARVVNFGLPLETIVDPTLFPRLASRIFRSGSSAFGHLPPRCTHNV